MNYRSSCPVVLGTIGVALLAAILGTGCQEETTNGGPPDASAPIDTPDGGGEVPSTCAPATGAGTVHGARLEGDSETWTAAGSPHVIEAALLIQETQTLTLEPCAVVRVKERLPISVRGKIIAEGAADKPITIEAADATPWAQLEANETSELRFVHTTIAGGGFSNGDALDRFGMLDIRGDQDLPTQGRLHADHLTVKGSASLGVLLREGGGFSATSKDVTITGGASYPINTWARAAGTIPSGTYTGNAAEAILIEGLGTRDAIREDSTLANHGVPYYVKGNRMNVGAPTGTAKTTLTIEAGVTIRFAKSSALMMDNSTTNGPANGVLRAVGTAAQPIVFTSAEATPAAGDWVGILFKGTPDPNNRIDHAQISYAGAPSGISSYDCPSPANEHFSNNGAIIVYGGQPASAFVTNTTIDQSAGDGIVRGWTGDVIDFTATNTFSGIVQCNQTYPKSNVSNCPVPAPCPRN